MSIDKNSPTDRLYEAARKLGASAGKASGSWVIDDRTTPEAARAILKGYDDGDPLILDMQPNPLSGEWADGLTEDDVLDEVESYADAEGADALRDEVVTTWLDAFSEGWWDEVIRAARRVAEVAA